MTRPFGREDVDLFGADLEPQGVEEFARVGGLGLPVGEVREPGQVGVDLARAAGALAVDLLLVLPVRRDAELGPLVHLLGTDLDLDRPALGTDDRRVQRLVQVELRRRDVVLEATGHRRPPRVDLAQDRVAVAHRVDEDADAHQVVDLVELATAHDHLLVDRVVLLRAPDDLAADLRRLEVVVDRVDDVLHESLALGRALTHEALDLGVQLRVEHREREVLEFPLDRLDAQPMSERSVDLERLGGLAGRGFAAGTNPQVRAL